MVGCCCGSKFGGENVAHRTGCATEHSFEGRIDLIEVSAARGAKCAEQHLCVEFGHAGCDLRRLPLVVRDDSVPNFAPRYLRDEFGDIGHGQRLGCGEGRRRAIKRRLAREKSRVRFCQIGALGISNALPEQVEAARSMTEIVCVQNMYNLANRGDDDLIDHLAGEGIAYVPFFPLGGFDPLQSDTLDGVARDLDATPLQVALAWLLQRSPNILLIPGTSSVDHLRQNVAAANLHLPEEAVATLNGIGK